jgi:hypothetical protein
VRPIQLFHILTVEGSFHWLNAGEKCLDLREMLGTEHARFRRRLVGVVLENVPSAENKIFRVRQRNEFLDQWRTPFGAFAQADRAHLRQRPYRARFVSADQFDARHEGGADGAHSR